jgi:superfamily II DNA helicase RecQ
MGIDNPHVRFVVHWTPPRSFEGLVQESGRAGRDGRAAVSIVYYNLQERDRVIDRISRDPNGTLDTRTHAQFGPNLAFRGPVSKTAKIQNREARLESFQRVVKYCETTTRCRHEVIREYSEVFDFGHSLLQHQQRGDISAADSTSPCGFACDFCKEGSITLTRRMQLMVPETLDDYTDSRPLAATFGLTTYEPSPYEWH